MKIEQTDIPKSQTDIKLFNLLNQSIPILMGMFLFFHPFPHITSIKEICFYLSVFLSTVLIFLKKAKISFQTPLSLPLGLFALWAFFSIFFALDKANSINDFYSHLIKYLIFYFILVNYFNSKKRLFTLIWTIIISSAVFAAGSLTWFYVIQNHSLNEYFGYDFMEISTNLFVIVTGTGFVLSLHFLTHDYPQKIKIVSGICSFVLLLATTMTQSRSAIIATIMAIIILFSQRKKLHIILILLCVLIVVFSPLKARFFGNTEKGRGYIDNYRLSLYRINWNVMWDYPITGIGFGNNIYGNRINFDTYNKALPTKMRLEKEVLYSHTKEPHNMYLSIGVRTGFIGLLLFLWFIFNYIRMVVGVARHGKDEWHKDWSLTLLAAASFFLIIGLFEQGLSHITEVNFFTLISMATIVQRLNQEGNDQISIPMEKPG